MTTNTKRRKQVEPAALTDYARRLSCAILKAQAAVVRVCARNTLAWNLEKLTMGRDSSSDAQGVREEHLDEAVGRVSRLHRRMIKLILDATGWRPGLTPGDESPEDWPCPAVSVGGVLWAARVTDLGIHANVTLVRIELPKVVDLDAAEGGAR
jgi:hypothetical protein